jgi:hypothetical protein
VGYGAGGAATLAVAQAGKIPLNISFEKNEIITIKMTMNEACVSAHAGVLYVDSQTGKTTYADCNTTEDAAITAVTRESPGSVTIPANKGGRIKQIRVAVANVVNLKNAIGYVELEVQNHAGPFRFPIGGMGGGATNSGFDPNPVTIDVDIPVDANEQVTFWYYFTDAQVNAHVGIVWV